MSLIRPEKSLKHLQNQPKYNLENFLANKVNLTGDIYVRHNSGDLNDLGTKIWGFFPEIAKFRTQIKSWYLGIISSLYFTK